MVGYYRKKGIRTLSPIPSTQLQQTQWYRNDVTTPLPIDENDGKITHKGGFMANTINMLLDVNVPIGVQLGQTRMTIRELLNLKRGGIVRLNRMAGEAVDVFISKKLMAKGEVTVVDDRLSVRIVQLYGEREKFKHL
jgi:flagellar motor switch protein FliN/FliY